MMMHTHCPRHEPRGNFHEIDFCFCRISFGGLCRVVALVDVRFSGVYYLPDLAGVVNPDRASFKMASPRGLDKNNADQQKNLLWAWERNSICWGYPLVAMTVTDIRALLDYLSKQTYADRTAVRIETNDLGHLAMAALFVAILDEGVTTLKVDLRESDYASYEAFHKRLDGLPIVPFILRYGDVPQWISVLADRNVTFRRLARAESEGPWLQHVFSSAENAEGITGL